MGKDFIPLKANGINLVKAYSELNGINNVKEASDEKWFKRTPTLEEVKEIEIGTDDTTVSIIRLKDGGFIVVNKTIKIEELKA